MNRRNLLRSAMGAVAGLLGWKASPAMASGSSDLAFRLPVCDVCGWQAVESSCDMWETEPVHNCKTFEAGAIRNGCEKHLPARLTHNRDGSVTINRVKRTDMMVEFVPVTLDAKKLTALIWYPERD